MIQLGLKLQCQDKSWGEQVELKGGEQTMCQAPGEWLLGATAERANRDARSLPCDV